MENSQNDRVYHDSFRNAGRRKLFSSSQQFKSFSDQRPNPWVLFRNFLSCFLFFFSGYFSMANDFFSNACSECISNLYIFSYRTSKMTFEKWMDQEKFFMSVGRPFALITLPLFSSKCFFFISSSGLGYRSPFHRLYLSYKWEWKFIC